MIKPIVIVLPNDVHKMTKNIPEINIVDSMLLISVLKSTFLFALFSTRIAAIYLPDHLSLKYVPYWNKVLSSKYLRLLMMEL